jgi:GntR family transcriptional regulator
MVIDRDWDEPVYQQVASILRQQIASGQIEARRPIPSIRALCQEYGIARATAGKAIGLSRPSTWSAGCRGRAGS